MKKTYILWNAATGAFAKRGNRFVLHEGKQPLTWDRYPRGFPSSAGWRFEEVCGVIVDPEHKGGATYIQTDSQVARFTKIIAKEKQT
jgi:hypothetical protein